MICQKCGEAVKENEKFCPQCGETLQQMETAATAEQVTGGWGKPQPQSNEYVEKGKTLSNHYRKFFREALKSPAAIGEETTRQQLVNGCINIFLFALFYGLIGNFHFHHIGNFFRDFAYMIVSLVAIPAILFGVANVLLKCNSRFQDVLARFGVFLTVSTALSVVAFLVSLPGMNEVSFFVQHLMFFSVSIVIVLTYLSLKKRERVSVDILYGLLIFSGAYYIFHRIIGEIFPNVFRGLFF